MKNERKLHISVNESLTFHLSNQRRNPDNNQAALIILQDDNKIRLIVGDWFWFFVSSFQSSFSLIRTQCPTLHIFLVYFCFESSRIRGWKERGRMEGNRKGIRKRGKEEGRKLLIQVNSTGKFLFNLFWSLLNYP